MTDRADDRSSLHFERRAADRFALIREYEGQKSELELTVAEILALARMIPSYARELTAPKHRQEAGVFAWIAAPATSYMMAMDAHQQSVLLKLRDDWEGEFDFSLTPTDARKIAEGLVRFAQKIDDTPKISRQ
jgi:hypothetical protein